MEENQEKYVIHQSMFLCLGKEVANFACASEGCSNNAFICDKVQCECKNIQHNKCTLKKSIKQLKDSIEEQKKQPSMKLKDLFADIVKNYDNIIEKISEDRIQFIQFTKLFGMNKKTIQIVKLVDQEKEHKISGQLIHNAFNEKKHSCKTYSPSQMTNYEAIKEISTEIQALLNILNFQIASQMQNIETALVNFGKQDIDEKKIFKHNQHWEFIPIQISMFKQLVDLDLSCNEIRKMKNIGQLFKLRELRLNSNQIDEIQGLDNLNNLQSIGLYNNKIHKLKDFNHLKKLKQLYIFGNPVNKIYDQKIKLQKMKGKGIKVLIYDWFH